jgi:hypothetical protein
MSKCLRKVEAAKTTCSKLTAPLAECIGVETLLRGGFAVCVVRRTLLVVTQDLRGPEVCKLRDVKEDGP